MTAEEELAREKSNHANTMRFADATIDRINALKIDIEFLHRDHMRRCDDHTVDCCRVASHFGHEEAP